jgi:hypothetical protein
MEDIKIKLSVFWAAHFLIWSFGDVLSLLSPDFIEDEIPVDNDILIVAAIIGTVHAYMIIGSITLKAKQNRLFNLGFGGVFTLININHLVETIADNHAWAILLALVYLSINAIILSHAYKWQINDPID